MGVILNGHDQAVLAPFPESICSPVSDSEPTSQMIGVQCYVFVFVDWQKEFTKGISVFSLIVSRPIVMCYKLHNDVFFSIYVFI